MEAPSSSQTCKVLDCAVAPVVHIIMENGSKAPKAIRMAPEGAPTPQGLALYVITEEIIVSLPALTHRQRGMIKIRGSAARCGHLDFDWSSDPEWRSKPSVGLVDEVDDGVASSSAACKRTVWLQGRRTGPPSGGRRKILYCSLLVLMLMDPK